jgi:hypothetical protein
MGVYPYCQTPCKYFYFRLDARLPVNSRAEERGNDPRSTGVTPSVFWSVWYSALFGRYPSAHFANSFVQLYTVRV